MNIFEVASRKKFRFPSGKGNLTVEQLWDLPLTAASGPSLDTTARQINGELKSLDEESFVETKWNPRKTELATQLDIVKHIIAERKADAERAKNRADRAVKRRKLIEALAAKEDAELTSKSKAQLLKELDELDE